MVWYLFLLVFLYVYYRHTRFTSFGQDLLFMAGLVIGNEYGYGMAYWLNYIRTVGFPFGFKITKEERTYGFMRRS